MKQCLKCNKEFNDDKNYCESCGGKLKIKKEEHSALHESKHDLKKEGGKSHKIAPWLIPWIVLGVLLIAAGALLLPTKAVSYTVEVPYIDTEKYTVEVPYEDVEEYTVQVPYDTKEQYVESIPVQEQQEYLDKVCTNQEMKNKLEFTECSTSSTFSKGKSTLKVTNLDSEGGTFIITIGYVSDSGESVGTTISKYIEAGSSDTFTYSPTPKSFSGCNIGLPFSIPTKQVCDYVKKDKTVTVYKDVIKEKPVTKYRDETKYRKVTKTRTETREKEIRKTRIETKQKEVNWLFGFDAIVEFRKLN